MDKKLIEEFYLLALVDITNGKDIAELEEAIEMYEQVQEYEACAGILKAIHESGYMTIREIINTINENDTKND
tara:strand:+ start:44 stop:262 length:219 start_codon:yes stop_codon:yes gene_type:complete